MTLPTYRCEYNESAELTGRQVKKKYKKQRVNKQTYSTNKWNGEKSTQRKEINRAACDAK